MIDASLFEIASSKRESLFQNESTNQLTTTEKKKKSKAWRASSS